jgi:DNA-binding NarL/FixJ family response regulator
MNKLRILLADDHAVVREGLRLILDAQPDMMVVAEAADGRSAVDLAEATLPDVVIMDVAMPLLNGLRATEAIVRRSPAVKVLPLTRHAESSYVRELLRAGAAGYVLKQSPSVELLAAIRAVAAGRAYLDPGLPDPVLDEFARPWHVRRDGEAGATLTARESAVIRLVALGHTNKDIASRFDLSIKTVETHKAHAMHKLGIRSRVELVQLARLRGWLQEDD